MTDVRETPHQREQALQALRCKVLAAMHLAAQMLGEMELAAHIARVLAGKGS